MLVRNKGTFIIWNFIAFVPTPVIPKVETKKLDDTSTKKSLVSHFREDCALRRGRRPFHQSNAENFKNGTQNRISFERIRGSETIKCYVVWRY